MKAWIGTPSSRVSSGWHRVWLRQADLVGGDAEVHLTVGGEVLAEVDAAVVGEVPSPVDRPGAGAVLGDVAAAGVTAVVVARRGHWQAPLIE